MAKLVSKVYGDAYVSAIKGSLSDALEEVRSLRKIFVQNDEILLLLDSPKMNDIEKLDFIKNIFENRISRESMGFLLTMIEKKRQNDFAVTFDYIIDRLKELLGIGKAVITTALPLNEARKSEIEARLQETSHYNALEARYIVDEAIIGGIIIRIGDRVVDSSVRTAIEKMRRALS